jgi:hypothetical protein
MKETMQGACTVSTPLLNKTRTSNTFYAKPGQEVSLPFSHDEDKFTLSVKMH